MYALATIHGVSPVAKPTPQIVKSDVSSKIAAQTNCLNLMNNQRLSPSSEVNHRKWLRRAKIENTSSNKSYFHEVQ